MPIIAKSDGGSRSFEPIPAGVYAARCYSMVHIGTVKETIEGREKILNKVRIGWELPTEKKVFQEEKGEQPHVISKEFTLSMHPKASLRKLLEAWRGKAFSDDEAKSFDITKLLGVACMLNIIHKVKGENRYAEISTITGLPKGMEVPPQINNNFEFNYDVPFDQVKFDTLPEWIREKMKTSTEYKAAHHQYNPEQIAAMESEAYYKNVSADADFGTDGPDDLPF